jgi:hypothetical protein
MALVPNSASGHVDMHGILKSQFLQLIADLEPILEKTTVFFRVFGRGKS